MACPECARRSGWGDTGLFTVASGSFREAAVAATLTA